MLWLFNRKNRRDLSAAPSGSAASGSTRPGRPAVEGLEGRQLLSVPNGPFGASATAASSSVVYVTWHDNAADAAGFKIERRAGAGAFEPVGAVGAGKAIFWDSTASPGSQYAYRVRAYGEGGDSSPTDTNDVVTAGTPAAPAGGVPNGPFALSASAASPSAVQLNWFNNSNNEAGFKVERSVNGGGFQPAAFLGPGATSFTDAGLSPGATYAYRVLAYNPGGDSASTNVSAAATPGQPASPAGGAGASVPNGPFALSASASGATQISLSWFSNSSHESGFAIERRPAGGEYAQVAVVGAGVTHWSDAGVAAGAGYAYRVRAFSGTYYSAYSSEAAASTPGSKNAAPLQEAASLPSGLLGGVSSTAGGSTAGGSTAAVPTAGSADGTSPPAGFFPIAGFSQGEASFDTWKARGVNTMVHYHRDAASLDIWTAAAVKAGLWMIRNARANPADDLKQKYLLGFNLEDEPDIYDVSPQHLADEYAVLKKVAPNIPVLVNFSGANVIYPYDSLNEPLYKQYMQSADWVSNDVYPLSTYVRPDYIDNGAPLPAGDAVSSSNGLRWNAGNAVDVLRQWSGGKKQFAYIETSRQNIASPLAKYARPPTPDEFRGEVWDAIVHGARGIFYFPQSFFPDVSDATPADVAAEMTRQDARITALSSVITNISDSASNPMTSLGGALEGTWRTYQGHTYYFVLNFSHAPARSQTIALPGAAGGVEVVGESRAAPAAGGTITDNFAPYELHVYKV